MCVLVLVPWKYQIYNLFFNDDTVLVSHEIVTIFVSNENEHENIPTHLRTIFHKK